MKVTIAPLKIEEEISRIRPLFFEEKIRYEWEKIRHIFRTPGAAILGASTVISGILVRELEGELAILLQEATIPVPDNVLESASNALIVLGLAGFVIGGIIWLVNADSTS